MLTWQQYQVVRALAKQFVITDRMATALTNQSKAIQWLAKKDDDESKVAMAMLSEWAGGVVDALDPIEALVLRRIRTVWRPTPVGRFVRETKGLGPATLMILSLVPPLAPVTNDPDYPYLTGPAKLWRYVGLHPEGGRRRQKGEFLGYNAHLKAMAVQRIGLPIVRNRSMPYRGVYDRRREHTAVTHPAMLALGEGCLFCDAAWQLTDDQRKTRSYSRERTGAAFECTSLGGVHWSPQHQLADALRVTVKAALLDVWRVANGMEPHLGGHGLLDTQWTTAPAVQASHPASPISTVPALAGVQ